MRIRVEDVDKVCKAMGLSLPGLAPASPPRKTPRGRSRIPDEPLLDAMGQLIADRKAASPAAKATSAEAAARALSPWNGKNLSESDVARLARKYRKLPQK
jgi:nucleoid-associated protein YgaU